MEDSLIFDSEQSPYALFSVANVVYGIQSSNVLSIEILKKPTPVIDSPPYMRGIVDFRGDMVKLLDLRKLFGQSERGSGLRNFMRDRINDHENWLNSLETSIRNNTSPTVNFNPKTCGVGKWLETFKTESNALNMHVQTLIQPHNKTHETGHEIAALQAAGELQAALDLIEQLKETSYKDAVSIMESTADAFMETQHDMLIVLHVGEYMCGIIVDEIVSVEHINTIIERNEHTSDYVRSLAKRDRDNATVLLLDEKRLIGMLIKNTGQSIELPQNPEK